MNRKWLVSLMSVIMLAAVYIATNILLPNVDDVMEKSVRVGNVDDSSNDDSNINVNFSDKCVVIDSGHGGIDPGKESSSGILEKDINLSIALKLQELLETSQITVIMTRTNDSGLYEESDANKKIADMKKRCSIINDSNANMVISIHQNSFQSGLVKGAQVFYYKYSTEGKKLAEIVQNKLIENLDPQKERAAKEDNTYYLLLHTKIPTVIAECGFLSNEEEAALLNSEEYQMKVAQALYDGIIAYLVEL